jgi:phosphoglycerate kinase
MKTIRDFVGQMAGKRVLIRVDFNVPRDKQTLEITNDLRIRRALPTIRMATEDGARVVLMSHLGRPKGEPNPKFSLANVAVRLGELLGGDVAFAGDCVGPVAESAVAALADGQVLLLENTRFHAEEKKNDPQFAAALAKLGDIYINDAFGTAHRAHASTAGVAAHLPGGVGLIVLNEIEYLSKATDSPEHPYIAIMGGAKVSDKIQVIENLLPLVDTMLIGGAMAYTFLKQQGIGVGNSLVENDRLDVAAGLLASSGGKILLPVDHICAREIDEAAEVQVFDGEIPDGWIGLDIGPKTAALFAEKIGPSALVTWNGPLGFSEYKQFAGGTETVATAMADSDAVSIVGGGETAEAVENLGLAGKISHISTGGGASLTFLGGEDLPGITALE